MPTFKKIFQPHGDSTPLMPFLKEVKKRLRWQLWFWLSAFIVLMVLTIVFGVLYKEAKWMMVLFIIFFLMMFFSFLCFIWKVSIYRWSIILRKILKTRYRTSFYEDERLLISFNWVLRTFLSQKIVNGAIKENYEFLEVVRKKTLIDYQRINTPKVDVWIWRALTFISKLILTILWIIPMGITWWNFRFGWWRPIATKSIKTSFNQMQNQFLTNLDARTIW